MKPCQIWVGFESTVLKSASSSTDFYFKQIYISVISLPPSWHLQFLSSYSRNLLQSLSSFFQCGSGMCCSTHPLWCQVPYDFGFTFKHCSKKLSSFSILVWSSFADLEKTDTWHDKIWWNQAQCRHFSNCLFKWPQRFDISPFQQFLNLIHWTFFRKENLHLILQA